MSCKLLCVLGGTLIQIFTVPADKGKFHDKSSLGTTDF